jgi:pimeloyl-ACP methyl ester carboxylesterase
MTKHSITLAGGNEVAYWTHHDDQKPTIILVHGFTGSHEGFQYLVPLLSDFRLIIPDLPGFGVSPLPDESITLRHLGELLTELIDALELKEPPYLLGHSMGSLVVSEVAKQRPNMVAKKLILVSPVPTPINIADWRRVGALISQLYYVTSHRLPVFGKKIAASKKITRLSTNLIMTAKDEKVRTAIHEHHFSNLNYISSIGWYSRLYRQINRTGISRYRRALEAFDLLIINGNKDSVTPIKHQKRAAGLLGAKLVVISDVGHLSHYETPDALAKEIRHFLR